MPRIKGRELTGCRIEMMTVLEEFSFPRSGGRKRWYCRCRCDCGNEKTVTRDALIGRFTRSCGCFRDWRIRETNGTHLASKTREYRIWAGMLERCRKPYSKVWRYYGGAGIKVCDRWRQFENFFADMGLCPEGHTLDRIDNTADYTPNNCRWATMMTQQNNRSSNVRLRHNGRELTLAQWSREFGLHPGEISRRLHRGWSVARALSGRER